jgi:hypothetical protein
LAEETYKAILTEGKNQAIIIRYIFCNGVKGKKGEGKGEGRGERSEGGEGGRGGEREGEGGRGRERGRGGRVKIKESNSIFTAENQEQVKQKRLRVLCNTLLL